MSMIRIGLGLVRVRVWDIPKSLMGTCDATTKDDFFVVLFTLSSSPSSCCFFLSFVFCLRCFPSLLS